MDVEFADVRGRTECPASYGVRTRQGAFTIWNQQQGPESLLTTRIRGLSIGRADRPARGSGVFISGGGDERFGTRGRVEADLVELGEIYIDGGIATGARNLITSVASLRPESWPVRLPGAGQGRHPGGGLRTAHL
ncbi:hypothetical protein [Nocardia arthritidis]|uniref:Uncharacterized protein n=1 Tax=Nocardia arthritidis TaxID=228602 RepID=A0A6G9YLK2_9NOCA|nr:hypothetical protein [Nocardia arthritidis]QIS14084.1 hypothetical protein F5544_31210 [Nocardia arthritidis]